jgi:hypothetical protein
MLERPDRAALRIEPLEPACHLRLGLKGMQILHELACDLAPEPASTAFCVMAT